MDHDDIEALLDVTQEVSFAPGEATLEVRDKANAMFVVLDGEAQVDVGGRFHRLRRGAFLGEMALLAPDRRLATLGPSKRSELRIPAGDFGPRGSRPRELSMLRRG